MKQNRIALGLSRRFSSIRSRISLVYLLTIIPMALAAILVFMYSNQLLSSAQAMFDQNLYLEQVNDVVTSLDVKTRQYLNLRDNQALREFIELDSQLAQLIARLPAAPGTSQDILNLHLLRNLFEEYQNKVRAAVQARRGRLTQQYSLYYEESQTIIDYINLLVLNINWLDFQQNLQQYLSFSQWYTEIQFWSLIILTATAAFSLVLISFLSFRLSTPIVHLSEAARDFGKGDFTVSLIDSRGASREVIQLTRTFNTMKERISSYIEQLKETAKIKQDLMEQNIQNLHMKHVLKSAELIALQNQIQPHFLFNTINTGVQLAVVEGAERTSDYLGHLAEVYRYNLRKADSPVSLREELSSLESYIYVLKIRFGDRISFITHVDEDCLNLLIPPLVLQPLVENSVGHGLSEITDGGEVRIRGERKFLNGQERLVLSVGDNGKGMSKEKAAEVLAAVETDDPLDMMMSDTPGSGW
ncbi:sensor histidine kinase [Salinispira pacifica]|uniref:Autolysin sensor kinase n=1 Tax=Salinispira pacifica TaxID=1307761 RepID=V5WJK5_9SPIO|nr:histidine kinase [Salinispira pacifica]AHC15744.1 Autolysin sensor kinase [Salinispira pacifica]